MIYVYTPYLLSAVSEEDLLARLLTGQSLWAGCLQRGLGLKKSFNSMRPADKSDPCCS
jgi:hypothetical protein